MESIFNEIKKYRIVPVIKIEDPENALPLADALIEGGLPVAEVTFRTDAAEEAIKKISEKRPDILLGAGTVLTIENVEKAVNAGARFIVAPGFNPVIVDYCISKNIPMVPGINNPSQAEWAMERGVKVLKFFPAEISGGVKMLKALGSVYDIKFIPTGGINLNNLDEYLSYERVLAVGGTWMVKVDLISSGRFDDLISGRQFDKIKTLTKDAVEKASSFL